MAKHGGKREGAGRPAGSKSKRAESLIQAVHDSGLTPVEFMMSIYQDESKPETFRLDAAKAAAPYVHARLSNVDMSVSNADKPAEELGEADLQRIAAAGSDRAAEAPESASEPSSVH